ncbi:MAG: diguanylate cyclase [Planctomycetes bacterium]|nr:diguanylate cyclase [Planctomycetota bacterium]
MKSFYWDEHFTTGLSSVDKQHNHLIDILNNFCDHLTKNEIIFADLEEIFRELFDYADYHFKEEEEMMSQIGIDQRHYDFHVELHQYFLKELRLMQHSISPDNIHTAEDILDFLIHWLAYHILGSDQNMAKQIQAIQSGESADVVYKTEEQRIADSKEPLVVALTGLFHQLTIRNNELTRLNKTLEEKVAERTKALSEANLNLEKLSMTDMLTGLPNRRYALQQFAVIWDESSVGCLPLTCIMIDADSFKEVNDTYGHDAGDAVLRELADTLRRSVRSDDIVCRLGGDEFLIICPDTDLNEGMHVAEFVRKAVSNLHTSTGDGVWYGSVSVGVTARSPGMKDYGDLLKKADLSVYEAKRTGKNRVSSFESYPNNFGQPLFLS